MGICAVLFSSVHGCKKSTPAPLCLSHVGISADVSGGSWEDLPFNLIYSFNIYHLIYLGRWVSADLSFSSRKVKLVREIAVKPRGSEHAGCVQCIIKSSICKEARRLTLGGLPFFVHVIFTACSLRGMVLLICLLLRYKGKSS